MDRLYREEEDLYLFLDQEDYRINLSRKYWKDILYLISIWSIGISIVLILKLSTAFFVYGSTGNRPAKRGGPKRLAEAYSSPWHSSQTALKNALLQIWLLLSGVNFHVESNLTPSHDSSSSGQNSNRELDRFAIPLDPIPVPDPDDPRYPLGYRFTSLFPATRSFDPRFTSYSFI